MPLAPTTPEPFARRARLGEVLAVWHDVAPGCVAAVREWYTREHRAERLTAPGFREARRYDRVVGAGADMFGIYDVRSPGVMRGASVRDRPAEKDRHASAVMPHFRNSSVASCAIKAEAGSAEGGHLATLASTGMVAAQAGVLSELLLAIPGVLRVRAMTARKNRKALQSAETGVGEQPAPEVAWALLVDADCAEAAQTALYAAQSRCGVTRPAHCAVYRLAFCARNGT